MVLISMVLSILNYQYNAFAYRNSKLSSSIFSLFYIRTKLTISLDFRTNFRHNISRCYHNGRRFVLLRRTVTSDYIEICLQKSFGKEDLLMLTIESLIAVISLCATFFRLGYSFGRNSKTQK